MEWQTEYPLNEGFIASLHRHGMLQPGPWHCTRRGKLGVTSSLQLSQGE